MTQVEKALKMIQDVIEKKEINEQAIWKIHLINSLLENQEKHCWTEEDIAVLNQEKSKALLQKNNLKS